MSVSLRSGLVFVLTSASRDGACIPASSDKDPTKIGRVAHQRTTAWVGITIMAAVVGDRAKNSST